MDIGNNIKKLRELKNLTQEYMASEMGCSQKTYSNIEKSGNEIKIATVETIAKILNLSLNKILELNAEAILNNNSQSGGINQLNTAPCHNYIDIKAIELYEKLLMEKEELIKELLHKINK